MKSPVRLKAVAGSASKVAIDGFLWLMVLSIVARLTGLLSQVVLSRLLTTTDFGELGLASTVSTFVMTIIGFGIDDVLVQRRHGLEYWSGTALVISFSLSVVGALFILIVSPIAAALYHTKAIIGLLAVCALSMPIGVLYMLPLARIRANMQFRLLTTLAGIDVVLNAVLIVLFAMRGFGAYSFVLPLPIMSAARSIVYWIVAPVRMTRPRVDRAKYLFGRATSVFGHRVITQTIGQADYVLLGFATNPGQVGLYYFAFRLAVQPVNILAGNINGVLFPLLSQHRQQPERQKAIMLKALNTLNMVIIPICMLQAAIAPPLVPLVFGAKWAPAVGMLIVLTLGISVEAAAWQAGALLNSRGQFGKTFKYTVAISPLFFIFIGVGLWLGGAIGVACGVALYYFVFSSSFTYLAMRRDGVTARQVMVIYLKPAAMGAIAMGGGYLVGELPKIVEFPILRAGVTGLVGCVAYLTLWRMFGRDSYTTVVDWAVGRVVRLLRRSPPATVSD